MLVHISWDVLYIPGTALVTCLLVWTKWPTFCRWHFQNKISLKYVPLGLIDNKSALAQENMKFWTLLHHCGLMICQEWLRHGLLLAWCQAEAFVKFISEYGWFVPLLETISTYRQFNCCEQHQIKFESNRKRLKKIYLEMSFKNDGYFV